MPGPVIFKFDSMIIMMMIVIIITINIKYPQARMASAVPEDTVKVCSFQ
jgi:hypothetical protein